MIKKILSLIINLLLLPLSLFLPTLVVWNTVPILRSTQLLQIIGFQLPLNSLFWLTVIGLSVYVLFSMFKIILDKNSSVKYKNTWLHLNSWLITISLLVVSITGFIMDDPLIIETVIINTPRKISIGVILGIFLMFRIFFPRIKNIVNRKITAYETAKEIKVTGRSSVIFINFLKLFEILFPEITLLILLSLFVSLNVSVYFILILVASVIPMLANIIVDLNLRKEAKKLKEKEQDDLAHKIANIKEK